jgi:phenylacetate-CoA ligase
VRLDLFRSIPELTREDLEPRVRAAAKRRLETRAWYRNSSGGSTGEPVSLLQDRDYEALGMAAIEMHYGWAGRRAGEPMVKLWGSDREALLGTVGWRNKLGGFARNLRLINSFRMTRADMARHVETIRRTRPVLIEAYAESIYELARFMNESGVAISGVRNVVTSAGTLYPFIRKEVEEAFGCPALNRYGSREVGSFAGERTAGGGLEVFAYTHWVEVVDECGRPCGPGQEGDVLVTCLTNYTMPVIRYRIGDRAVVRAATDDPDALGGEP